MANLYKKTYPIPIPDGSEIVTRRGKPIVQWRDKRDRLKTAPLAEDGKRISTGCRDE